MQKDDLNPVAAHLVAAYRETSDFSRHFRDEYHSPPSTMAKIHHFLSVVQALVTADERYEMRLPYAEYGRVHIIDHDADLDLLLRSAGTVAIEQVRKYVQPVLPLAGIADAPKAEMLVYEFSRKGLDLSVADAGLRPGSRRPLAIGEPAYIGRWPWHSPDDSKPFDQSGADAFDELGVFAHDAEISE